MVDIKSVSLQNKIDKLVDSIESSSRITILTDRILILLETIERLEKEIKELKRRG